MRSICMNHRRWMLLGVALLVSACANPWSEYAQDFDEFLSAGWLDDPDPLPVTPIYCYGTIGAPDCYMTPQEGQGNRLQGFEGPPPRVADDR